MNGIKPLIRSKLTDYRGAMGVILMWILTVSCALSQPAQDNSPHRIDFVTVQEEVKLEVLDWGGSGRPVVLLAGAGDTAHVFDTFAPKLTASYHVYGITRRGFGASSAPPPTLANYSADRLGRDVTAVLSALNLSGTVLAGHSLAGEELSAIGSRSPERVAALIYMDAAYSYAFYDPVRGDFALDLLELRRKLDKLVPGREDQDAMAVIDKLLKEELPRFERDLQAERKNLETAMPVPVSLPPVLSAIVDGAERFTKLPVPILAVYAIPALPASGGTGGSTAASLPRERVLEMAQAFQRGNPSARVVRLENAQHDVIREMRSFIDTLPRRD